MRARSQILKILAQTAVPPAATTTPATAPAITPSAPTTVSGAPMAFDPYSFWPTMITGWGAENVAYIRAISNILNWAIFIQSHGKLDLNKLRMTNFVVDTSKYPDRILIMFVRFAILVYRWIYTTQTEPFTGPVDNKDQRMQLLKGALVTLPDGSINSQLTTKVGGNPKTIIINILQQIKQ